MTLIERTVGSGYTTATKVRNYAGLPSTTDVNDADLATFIKYASAELHRDIAVRHNAERLTGNIDGSNAVYLLPTPYVADRNLDGSVTVADLEVRTATVDSTTGAITRAAVTVSSIDARQGRVTLQSAPASSVDWIEADYESYDGPVYVDDLERACNALVAHYVYVRNKDPSRVTLAQLKGPTPATGSKWLDEYKRIVRDIKVGELKGGYTVDINRSDAGELIERGG